MTSFQPDPGHERPGSARLALVSGLLADAVRSMARPDRAVSVLDCGGGSGTFAVPLAVAGCDVTVIDISADALATLRRRADEAGVASSIHAVNGDVEALSGLVPARAFDVVVAHGILDAVDQPTDTLSGIAAAVRPGGLLSVLVANPVATVLGRALAGDPTHALRELRGLDAAEGRLGPDQVAAMCTAEGLVVQSRHGVGVFSDLVPGSALDSPDARDAVRALDLEAAARAPFAQIAGRVHLLVRRPAD